MSEDNDDLSPELFDPHPLERVWNAAVDACTSPDFQLPDGSLDEAKYLRYKRRVMDEVWSGLAWRSPAAFAAWHGGSSGDGP